MVRCECGQFRLSFNILIRECDNFKYDLVLLECRVLTIFEAHMQELTDQHEEILNEAVSCS